MKKKRNHERLPLTLATVVFVDVVGSTSVVAADRANWIALLRSFYGLVKGTAKRFEGRLAISMGDSALLFFKSPSRAISFALSLHQKARNLGKQIGTSKGIALRIAISSGEVVRIGDSYVGESINDSVRASRFAKPGETALDAATFKSSSEEIDNRKVHVATTESLKGMERIKLFILQSE